MLTRAPTYLRNIERGKSKEKSWYQYVFLGTRAEVPAFAGYSVARLHPVLGFDLFGLPGFYLTDLQNDAELPTALHALDN